MVEYLIAIAVVGVAAIGAWALFGDAITGKTDGQGEAIRTMAGEGGGGGPPIVYAGSPGESTGGAPAAIRSAPGDNPSLEGLLEGKGRYIEGKGEAYIRGEGDGSAVHPSDMSQGYLGDCYLISSLASIAHANPEVLEKGIRKLDDGNYAVTLYEKDGDGNYVAREIIVKPEFPSTDGSTFSFARPGDTNGENAELWGMLYEKAYAQMHGGYDKIGEGGWPGDAMAVITGRDSSNIDISNASLDDIADRIERGDAVVAASLSEEDAKGRPLYDSSTLYANHGYYVTEVDREAGTVTVRNPWGWNYEEITLTEEQFKDSFGWAAENPTSEWKEDEPEQSKPWWQFW